MDRRAFLRAGTLVAAAFALGGAGVLPLAGCASDSSVLRVGTKIDVPGFGFQNPETGNIEGMEVDIARELAKRIKGDPNALRVTGVNVTTRGAMLDNGTLDAALATFTITEQRKKSYNFSRPYYVDHIGVLVKKSSGIADLIDLDGKTVGVALSATTRDKLEAAADELGIRMFFSEYSTYPEIKIALVAGRVDAFSVDSSILNGYLDDSTMLLDTHFAPQEYGVATKKANDQMAQQIDEAIADMQADGTLGAHSAALGLDGRWGCGADGCGHRRSGCGRVPDGRGLVPDEWGCGTCLRYSPLSNGRPCFSVGRSCFRRSARRCSSLIWLCISPLSWASFSECSRYRVWPCCAPSRACTWKWCRTSLCFCRFSCCMPFSRWWA